MHTTHTFFLGLKSTFGRGKNAHRPLALALAFGIWHCTERIKYQCNPLDEPRASIMARCANHKQLFRSFLCLTLSFAISQLFYLKKISKANFQFNFDSVPVLLEEWNKQVDVGGNTQTNRSMNQSINVDNRNKSRVEVNIDAMMLERKEIKEDVFNRNRRQIEFSMCAIVKDEGNNLLEWTAYHYTMINLRHLILCNDLNSTTNPLHILDKWKDMIRLDVWNVTYFAALKHAITNQHFYFYLQSFLT